MIINLVVKYVAKVCCLNPTSDSGRNWCECVTIQNEVSMVDTNVKNVYKDEWYDPVSVNEIDSASVVKEIIDVRDGSVKCEIFNIDDVEYIINDLCILTNHFINIYFYHFYWKIVFIKMFQYIIHTYLW